MLKPQYVAGQIFRLPPGSTELDDWESHFHALLAVHTQDATATLVYASTSDTDAGCGAPSLLIQPNSQNGLTEPTHFYGAVVVVARLARLGSARGDIQGRMNDLRAVVRQAMGYRRGPAYNLSPGTPSLRGRIVELSERYASLYGTKYAAILTKHDYSVRQRHQMLAPLYDSPAQIATGMVPGVAMPPSLQLLFEKGAKQLHAPSELVRCLWEAKAIRGVTNYTVDETLLREIEDALCIRWTV